MAKVGGVRSDSGLHLGAPPQVTTQDGRVLVTWLQYAVATILQRINVTDEVWYHVSYGVPPKPRVGLTVYADGVKWNPGSGEGLYVYKSTGWKFIA